MKRRIAAVLVLAASLGPRPGAAATFVIVDKDAAGQGFNDPTPATPVGGNTGTTVGQQRMIVFQEVARIWGSLIPDNVTIKVDASFQPLSCNATSAILGSTYATTSVRDFSGAPLPSTWYARAEADKLTGTELDPTTSAMNATFNSNLGQANCLAGTSFYLGLDDNAGSNVNLQTTVLHEFAHGLGYYSKASSSGTFSQNIPGAFDRFLLDATLGKTWDQITDAQRLSSVTNAGNVVWTGPNATRFALSFLSKGRVGLSVSAPAAAAGSYTLGTASFGPSLSSVSVSGHVVAATDPSDASGASTTDACSALTNASGVAGNI
ncbi:MAG TPA: peptidase, partial [Thermoanaerobaculia bacterium]|nr:peptidase [Thermoanaerobaculia bacterium]